MLKRSFFIFLIWEFRNGTQTIFEKRAKIGQNI